MPFLCHRLVLHSQTDAVPTHGAGLFNWSMRHQDGTRPAEPARELTEEDRRFLELAMEEYAQARPAPVHCCIQAEPTPSCQSCLSPCCQGKTSSVLPVSTLSL